MSSGVEDTTKASRRPKGTGTVRQRGQGKWQLRVFVGTDTETGPPCQISRFVTARNKTEAQRKLRQWQEELPDSEPMGAGNATVRSLIEEWLRHSAARGRAPRTLHDARSSAETMIYPEFGDRRIVDLTPRDLDEWYRKLATGEGRSRALKANKHPTAPRRVVGFPQPGGALGLARLQPGRTCPVPQSRAHRAPGAHRRRGAQPADRRHRAE